MKKIIIEIAGGLGNQMFQYAFYVKMKQLGYDCLLYIDPTQHIHNGFELQRIFKLEASFTETSQIASLRKKDQGFVSKLLRKTIGTTPSFYWEHDKGYNFKEDIFTQPKSIYLQGCWLSERYFESVETEVRSFFEFPLFNDPRNIDIASQIAVELAPVSIHIRRGDYLKSSIHKNIDYKQYLTEAISTLKDKTVVSTFYVFSDDIPYAQSVLQAHSSNEAPFHFINWNSAEASFNDMHLISLCKHNIITNSTFSWWGAWLNNHPQKIILSPAHWFSKNELNNNSILPDTWIQL